MNTQYSRDGLLKTYQNEANEHRDRKLQEKQNRVIEERKALELINREMEEEKRNAQYIKMRRMNERLDDYNQMMVRKQDEKDNAKGRIRNKNDYVGTFKIGGENREFKKKNYDDVSNTLVLNPMKGNLNVERGRNELMQESRYKNQQQRGKSQGFNIINHSNVDDFGGKPNHTNQDFARGNPNEMNMKNYNDQFNPNVNVNPHYINSNRNPHIPQNKQVYNPQANPLPNSHPYPTDYYTKEPEGIENLENYPYGDKEINSLPKNEMEDPEFQKYYEEFLLQKMQEEELAKGNISNNPKIPTTMNEYEAYKNQNSNQNQKFYEDQNNVSYNF